MPTEQTNIVPGNLVEGKVQGITRFGAFIELPGGVVGLVHISEIADIYVKDVRDFIREGDNVKVKVLSVAGKKIGLSIKQATPSSKVGEKQYPGRNNNKDRNTRDVYRKNSGASYEKRAGNSQGKRSGADQPSLDDKIAKFLKESDERMQPLKNKIEPRRRNKYNKQSL